jgi:hypothetical protein
MLKILYRIGMDPLRVTLGLSGVGFHWYIWVGIIPIPESVGLKGDSGFQELQRTLILRAFRGRNELPYPFFHLLEPSTRDYNHKLGVHCSIIDLTGLLCKLLPGAVVFPVTDPFHIAFGIQIQMHQFMDDIF